MRGHAPARLPPRAGLLLALAGAALCCTQPDCCDVRGVAELPGCSGQPCTAVIEILIDGNSSAAGVQAACQDETNCVTPLQSTGALAGDFCDGQAQGEPTGAPVVGPGTIKCRSINGCPEFGCRSPRGDFKCSDCWLEGARVTCPSDDDAQDRALAGGLSGAGAFLAIVGVVVLCVRSGAKSVLVPLEPQTEGPAHVRFLKAYRARQSRLLRWFGAAIAERRWFTFFCALSITAVFAAVGLPFITLARASGAQGLADWVPEGGRLEREVKYVDTWTDVMAQEPYYFYVLVGPRDGSNALAKRYLQDTLDIMEEIRTMTVPARKRSGGTLDISFEHVCMSIDNPTTDLLLGVGLNKPCANPGVLDCFFEGAWQYENVHGDIPPRPRSTRNSNLHTTFQFAKLFGADGLIAVHEGRPSFRNMTNEEVRARFKQHQECTHWSVPASLPRDKIFAGSTLDADGRVVFARRLTSFFVQLTPTSNVKNKPFFADVSEGDLFDAMNDLYDLIMDRLEQMDNDRKRFPNTSVSCYFSVSLSRMIDEVGRARVVQLVVGYGLMLFFLVVSQISVSNPAENHWNLGFIAFFTVVISNAAAFGVIALLGFEYNHTMLQALPFLALGLGVDDVFLLLHYFRGIPDKTRPAPAVIADLMEAGGASVALTSLCNACCFFGGAIIPIPALRAFLVSAGVVVLFNFAATTTSLPALMAWQVDRLREHAAAAALRKENEGESFLERLSNQFSPQRLMTEVYFPILVRPAVRIALCILFVITFGVLAGALFGFAPLKFGTKITDLTPKGSYLAKGFDEMYSWVYSQSANMAYCTTREVHVPTNQLQLIELQRQLLASRWSSVSAGDAEHLIFWMPRVITHCGKYNGGFLIKDPATGTDMCDPSKYMEVFHDWRNPYTGGLESLEALLIEGFGYRYGPENYTAGNEIMLTIMTWSMNMKLVLDSEGDYDPEKWIDHIDDIRGIMINTIGNDRDVFPFGYDYMVMEEFVSLRQNFWVAFAVCISACLVASLVVPVSWRGAPFIALSAAATTIELAAIVSFLKIHFNSTLAVTLLMSIGISIEFSAHVVVAFEGFPGTRTQRLRHTAERTFVPVVESAVSSFLGFSLLVLSDFPYVVKYFFVVYLFVVLIGMVHALVFLPALLSMLGTADAIPKVAPEPAANAKPAPDVMPPSDGESA